MRLWLYNQLIGDTGSAPSILSILQPKMTSGQTLADRISQGETMQDRLAIKPYIFYTIGNSTNDQLSEDSVTYNQFFQIYVHDVPGDYELIDKIVKRVIRVLHGAHGLLEDEGIQYDILNVKHLETSRDLDDVTLGTIMRYIRFVAKVKEYTDG